MKALIVYESVFGNTEIVAKAIGEGISLTAEVTVVEVNAAPTTGFDQYGLIVVGGPVHAFGMTRSVSRRDGATKAGKTSVTGDRGLREWFKDIETIGDVPTVAFDTRVEKIFGFLPVGSARRAITNRLKERGCSIIDDGEGFFVTGIEGPLEQGEVERAREWGRILAEKAERARGFAAA
jgi:hypothetical protein